jgi:uracil-DNA glycosylase family 4
MEYNPNCTLCSLSSNATTVCMNGTGPSSADIMIVGEGPGWNEDRQGTPFVGKAGAALNEMLCEAGFNREEIFITNAVKCRPPENRDPTAKELKACRQYLADELQTVRPRVVLAFGNHALRTLTGESGINKHRGTMLPLSAHYALAGRSDCRVFASVHPAAGLRYPHMRRQTEEDLALLKRTLDNDFVEVAVPWEDASSDLIIDLTYVTGAMAKQLGYEPDIKNTWKDGGFNWNSIPLPDNSARIVLFDPPHIVLRDANLGDSGKLYRDLAEAYGRYETSDEAKTDIAGGFREIERVLKPGGICIFKWCDLRMAHSTVQQLIPATLPPFDFTAQESGNRKNIGKYTTVFYYLRSEKQSKTSPFAAYDLETNARETRDPFCHVYCCAIDSGLLKVSVYDNLKSAADTLEATTRIVGHNSSRFDRLMLRRITGRDIKCDDTMLMGFLLHEEWGPAKRLNLESLCAAELGVRPWKKDVTWNWRDAAAIPQDEMKQYCARDTRYTRELALKLAPKLQSEGLWNLYDKLLLPASRALADMEERGVYVNAANVAEARVYWEAEAELQLNALHKIKPDFNPRSSKQVGELLFEELGYAPVDRTKAGKASTAVGTLKTLREQYRDDPVFDALLKYRRSQKMLGTYIAKFENEPDRWGMLYPWYAMTQTVTGRTSGDLQQIPRTDTGPMIRRCIGVLPGKVLLSADFSQLEMRVAASKYVFDEPNLRQAFVNGEDVHRLLAATINGKRPEDVTKEERQNAKPPNFLFLFGGEEQMYIRTLLEDQDVVKTYEQAQFERDAFFSRWSGLAAGHGRVIAALDRDGFVRTFFGFKRRLPNARAEDRRIVVEAYREAVNVVVQNPACYMALIGLVLLGAAGFEVRSFQHDAYLLWVDDNEAAVRAATAQIRGLLEDGVPQVLKSEFDVDFDVPLRVDIQAGTCWTQDDRQGWVE